MGTAPDWMVAAYFVGIVGGVWFVFESVVRILILTARGVVSLVRSTQDRNIDRQWKRQAERSRALAPDRAV